MGPAIRWANMRMTRMRVAHDCADGDTRHNDCKCPFCQLDGKSAHLWRVACAAADVVA